MKKRILSFICAAALVLTMTACNNTTTTSTNVESETTEAVASTDDSSTASDTSQVQADASSGQFGDQNAPSDSNGTPPEKPDGGNAPGDSNGTPPDKPDGDNAGQSGSGFGGSGKVTQGDSANTIDSGSTWNLTGSCTISSLTNNGTINFNGYTITLADGTVLK